MNHLTRKSRFGNYPAQDLFPLHLLPKTLEGAGFILQEPKTQFDKPKYVRDGKQVIVCVPCGWIIYSGVKLGRSYITEEVVNDILKCS